MYKMANLHTMFVIWFRVHMSEANGWSMHGSIQKMEYTMHCTVSKKEHKWFVFSLKIFTVDTYIWLISEWTSGCFFLYRSVCVHVIRNFACRICWICCPSLRKLFHIETEGTYFAGQKFHLFRWGRTDLKFYL